MKKNPILYLVSGGAFIVASACSFITYFTGTKESSLWFVLGCMFFILAVPAVLMFSKSRKKS